MNMNATIDNAKEVFIHGKNGPLTEDEYLRLVRQMHNAYNSGSMDEFNRIRKSIPISADTALAMRNIDGTKALKKTGMDYTEAEMKFGKDWLDHGPEFGIFPYDREKYCRVPVCA
jgi:hypothetical protein